MIVPKFCTAISNTNGIFIRIVKSNSRFDSSAYWLVERSFLSFAQKYLNVRRNGGTCLQTGRLVDEELKNIFVIYAIKSLKREYIYVCLSNKLDRRLAKYYSDKNKSFFF